VGKIHRNRKRVRRVIVSSDECATRVITVVLLAPFSRHRGHVQFLGLLVSTAANLASRMHMTISTTGKTPVIMTAAAVD
jgi:hypothetical protein